MEQRGKRLAILLALLGLGLILFSSAVGAQSPDHARAHRREKTAVFNNTPGGGGITRTPFQMTEERPPAPDAPYKDIAFILSIDYIAKTMKVSIRGSSGPTQNLAVMSSVDIGTSAAPKVVPGNWAIIQRISDQYFITGYQVFPTQGSTPTAPASQLAAPVNFNVQVVGANLVLSWNPVQGAIGYRVYVNTSASPIGATVLNINGIDGDVGNNTTVQVPFNLANPANLLVNNPGFELGSTTGWLYGVGTGKSRVATIVTTPVRSGTYALQLSCATTGGPSSGNPDFETIPYPAVAGQSYTAAVWWWFLSGSITTVDLALNWYDVNKVYLTSNYQSVTPGGVSVAWAQLTNTAVAPVSTAYVSLGFAQTQGAGLVSVTAYDDATLSGLSGNTLSASDFFAVQAYGSFGQVSPFSYWLQPVQSSQAVGSPMAPHLQISNPYASVHSSLLAPTTGVAISPSGFTDTGWNVPLISVTSPTAETWTYASATTFTNTGAGDATGRYFSGVKLRLKQGSGYLYYTVSSSSYSAPNTTVTIAAAGGGANLTNTAITDNYYSYQATPQGFPAAASTADFPFGDGHDGALSTTGNVTLTRDMMYTNLTVNAGHTVFVAGFKIYVSGTLSNALTGIIDCSGGAGGNGQLVVSGTAIGGTAGAAAYTGPLPKQSVPTAGTAGGSVTNSGTTVTGAPAVNPDIIAIASAYRILDLCAGGGGGGGGALGSIVGTPSAADAPLMGSLGGRGGSAIQTNAGICSGGGGGGGGGVLQIYANTINNAGSIQANGGNGGSGGVLNASSKGGNGGGGAGGVVELYYRTTTGSGVGTLSAAGGSPGTSGNGGASGAAGVTASYQI